MSSAVHSTWLEIDLGAIQNNIRQIRSIIHRPLMPVVKANGYGHGLVEVGRAAVSVGAEWLGVARLEEALALRQAGIRLPVLVLGFCPPDRVPEAVASRASLAVHHPEIARAFSEQARSVGQRVAVDAKIDTGMGRLGVLPDDGPAFIRFIQDQPGLELEGLFTHLARADEPGLDTTGWQLERFKRLVGVLEAEGLRPKFVHAANSAAALYFPAACFDLARPGIAIYGLHPSPQAPLPPGFRAAMCWKARLASVKDLPAGHGVSYNHRYTTRQVERIGVVPAGYADGFRRRPGGSVLAGGRRVPVVGAVCMDQFMVQLDGVPQARIGDEVVLLGAQGESAITAEELAQDWGTINYEVVCGMAGRLPRVYR
jgi:alanine racemase